MDLSQITQKVTREAQEQIAQRSQVDLYYLCKYILGYGDIMDPKVHGPLCRMARPLIFYQDPEKALEYEFPSDYGREEHEGMPSEAEKKEFLEWQRRFEPDVDAVHAVRDKLDVFLTSLLVLMPRGTLKTSVLTMGLAVQWGLNFPEDRVLLDSETYTKSVAFLAEIKGHYQSNRDLRKVFYTLYSCFPDDKKSKANPFGTEKWATEAINLACRTKERKEESISCAGIDVTKTGMHYDLVLMDDLHSEKNTKTAEQIEGVKMHYKLVFSLLDPGKPAAVIGTRWDYNDLYQEIIDTESDEYNFITRSAEAADGELLYPRRLSRQFLDKQRRKQGPYIYSCQYLNNPVDNETAEFKRSQFRYRTLESLHDTAINWYGLVDPSEEGPYSDFAAIVIAGMDWRGEIYARFVYKAKMTYAEIVNKMFELDILFAPDIKMWGLETVATQKSIMYILQQEQKRRNRFLRLKQFNKRSRTKEERIRALTPYYEFGRAWHITHAPQIDQLEIELINFPRAKNDDVSDCYAGILELGTPPRHETRTSEVDEKIKKRFKMLNKPRSPMVGY